VGVLCERGRALYFGKGKKGPLFEKKPREKGSGGKEKRRSVQRRTGDFISAKNREEEKGEGSTFFRGEQGERTFC